ncbi:MAG: 50S ribosomal protein L10, partial [Nanoarchaeota archaeon]
MSKPQAHVAAAKKTEVKELISLFSKYPIIGIVNMEGLPSSQLGGLKKALRGKADLYMTKRRLMKIAIEEAKSKVPQLETIIPHLKGMPAFLFTKENPFALYKFLKKNKSPAPAKAGQESPRDITVPAGPTPFAPGPVISELAAVGIKAGVENGKVAVRQ